MKKYYVYRFKNKDNIIVYVGRSIDLNQRFKQHSHLTEDICTIEYIECSSEAEMIWKEIYYINLFYNELSTNIADVYSTEKMNPIELNDTWLQYKKSYNINSYGISLDEYNAFMDKIPRYNYKRLIHILEHSKLNKIGEDKYAMTMKWFVENKNKSKVLQLKNNTLNYFLNILPNSYSVNNLWTSYADCENILKGKGYSKGFIELHNYNLNPLHNKINLAYIANIYYPVGQQKYEITEDQYALYNILNFLFKSTLYYGNQINLYIPSKRMRTLLQEWIDSQEYLDDDK